MTNVEPKVFFIAESGIPDNSEAEAWLTHLGVKDTAPHISAVGGDVPGAIVALAARRCYKSYEVGLNPNVRAVRSNLDQYLANVIQSGHGSVLEHVSVTYAFEDVSRVFTHEIVRHRAGVAISQESLRYVRLGNLRFWIPPEVVAQTEPRPIAEPWPPGVTSLCTSGCFTPLAIFKHVIATCEWAQRALAQYYGIDSIQDFSLKKRLTSMFRRLAPIGLATGIVITFNMRALRWVIEQRTAPGAEAEMRLIASKLAEDAVVRYPSLFADFEPTEEEGAMRWAPSKSKV